MTITPGSTVQLKSGGPHMTVVQVQGDMVDCVWFDQNHSAEWGDFNKDLLDCLDAEPGNLWTPFIFVSCVMVGVVLWMAAMVWL